jgi:competence protein ComEC
LPGLLPWQSYFLAFVLGVFAFKDSTPALAALAVLLVADTSIRGWLHRLPILAFVFCAVFGFGYASQRAPEPVETPAWMEARQVVEVQAVVDRAEPRQGGRLRLVLRDVSYSLDGAQGKLPGMVSWNWRKPNHAPAPGQSVSLPMRLVPLRNFGNPGGWDYEWYWQRQGVNWRGWPAGRNAAIVWGDSSDSFLWKVKTCLRTAVSQSIPDSQGGAMLLALIAGDRSLLDATTVDATRSAGLAHTLALSGLHVGFVAAIGFGLAWVIGWMYPPLLLRVPRPNLAIWLAAPLVLGYAWLGQPSQSLLRAATMFAFWGFLLLQGRGRVLMDGLFFALAVIVVSSPFSVFDLSLQMSALAVAGIGLMMPKLQSLLNFGQGWWQRGLSWAMQLLGLSLCANVALLPLVSWTFGTWTPNILLNLIWLPVLGFAVMPLGIVGMLFSAFGWTAPFGNLLLTGGAFVMDGLLLLLHTMDDITPVVAILRPLWLEILGGALLFVTALVALVNRRVLVGLACLGFVLLVWPHVGVMLADAQDEVRVSLIDVGQGQAALISTPGGHRWLVDGGAGSSSFDFGESVVAPYLTYGRPPRLDGVFMSHPDLDHSHGLSFILTRFTVGAFYTNGMLPRGRNGKRMRAALKVSGVEPIALQAGHMVEMGDDIRLEVLHPAVDFEERHANERSLVLRLVRDGVGLALIPGDIEMNGVNGLLASGLDIQSEILVLPHHGSRSSYSVPLYEEVSPKVALCASGYINRYGFPHEEVVRDVAVPVFDTARHGMVTAKWGRNAALSVTAFKP